MSEALAQERSRAEAALARSEAALASSLDTLAVRARGALSPRRAARDHLGAFLLGAFALGVVLGSKPKEARRP